MNDKQKEDIRLLIKAQEVLKNFIGSRVEDSDFSQLFIYVNALEALKEVIKINPLPMAKVDLGQQKNNKEFSDMLRRTLEEGKENLRKSLANKNTVLNDNRLIGENLDEQSKDFKQGVSLVANTMLEILDPKKIEADIEYANSRRKIINSEVALFMPNEIDLLWELDLKGKEKEKDIANKGIYKDFLNHFTKRIDYIRKFYLSGIDEDLGDKINPIRFYNEQIEAFEYMSNLIREHIIYLES